MRKQTYGKTKHQGIRRGINDDVLLFTSSRSERLYEEAFLCQDLILDGRHGGINREYEVLPSRKLKATIFISVSGQR